jgi:hypothetical protein
MNNLINCNACDEQNPATAKFCRSCGVKLELVSMQGEQVAETSAPPQWSASQMAVSSPSTAGPKDNDLAVDKPTSAVSPPADYTPSPYAAREYAALRSIAALCRTLSWIAVGLAGLQALGGLWLMTESFFVGFVSLVAAVLGGGLIYILLQVVAESISVLLDIEANTRRAASILEQRLQ